MEAGVPYSTQDTGRSFVEYPNEVRVGKACALLISTDRTVTEICYASGYNTLANFNRIFRRLKRRSLGEFGIAYAAAAARAAH
jgi:AraC-like DNA-binding protein